MRQSQRLTLGLAVAVTAAVSSAGFAATGQAKAASSKGTLLMEIPLRTNPSNALMAGGFLTECHKLGYKCEDVGTVAVDVPGSNALASSALARGGVVGFADYGFSPETYPFMKQVSSQNHLPIVSWHVPIPKGTVKGLTAITDGNPAVGGKQAADAMGAKLGGKGTVAVTSLSFNTTENGIAKDFTTEMHKKYPHITVLPQALEGSDPAAAVTAATGIVQAHSDVTAAFSTTGGGCTTWTGAEAQTSKHLTIICMDYVPQNLAMVKAGKVFGVVAQPLFQEGEKTAEILAAAVTHKHVSYYNPLPEGLATKKNIDQYETYINQAKKAGVPGI